MSRMTAKRTVRRRFNRTTVLWIMVVVVLAAALIGSVQYMHRIEHPARFSDAAYLVLLTFTVNLPDSAIEGGYPLALEFARFCAPVVIAYATFLLVMIVFRQKFDELRARRSRDHIVVCGLGSLGQSLIASMVDHPRRVVVIDRAPLEEAVREAHNIGALVVIGDARDSHVLQRAAVGYAETIVVVCGPDDVNGEVLFAIQQAVTSRQVRKRTIPVKKPAIQVNIRSRELAEELARHDLRFGTSQGCPVDYSCLEEVGARRVLSRYAPGTDVANWPGLILVGDGPILEALILQVARTRARVRECAPLEVAIVGTHAQELIGQLIGRHPELQSVLALSVETGPGLFTGVQKSLERAPESAVYVCLEDGDQSLSLALTLQLEDHPPFKIVVESMRNITWLDSLQNKISGCPTIEGFGILDEVFDRAMLLGGTTEELARAIHEEFVAERRLTARQNPINTPESSLVPWPKLSAELREQNRSQARDIVEKITVIGGRVVPILSVRPQSEGFSEDEVEMLAEMEHERWVTQKELNGWRPGPRSEERKTHPSLVPYESLDESEKDKDRNAIRLIPTVLARVGLEVVRAKEGETD